jgi:CubicO group peptidase (beta-lactamase class C family)
MRTAIVSFSFVVAALAVAASAQSPAGWESLKKFFERGVKDHAIAGASLAWITDGRIAALETAGLADTATAAPIDAQTIYHWASITKTFTAVGIMQLRDRGLLTLDDPIVDYVPELAAVHNPYGPMRAITIRHLLSHSAGFRAGTWPWGGDKAWHPFEPPGWEQVAAMMPYTEVLFPPGSKYSYSNPGLIFLGLTIEKLSGEPFETYIDKQILRPLGMRDAFFDRAPAYTRAHRSHSYYVTDEGTVEAPFDFDTGITVSNGGLNAPITDMAKWIAFLMDSSPDHDAILKRRSLEEMFTPVVPVGDGGAGEQGVGEGSMGLSFFLETHRGVPLIAHSGSQNGFIAHFYLHRPSHSAYIVAFNTETSSKTRGAARDTRAFDAALRDEIVRTMWGRK